MSRRRSAIRRRVLEARPDRCLSSASSPGISPRPGICLSCCWSPASWRCCCAGTASRRALTGAAGVGALVVLLLPAAPLALAPLEDRFPQPSLPAHIDGMVVLGGAVDVNVSRARGQPAVNDAAERIVAAAALSRRYPDAKIVLSGGAGWLEHGAEAGPTREILVSLGVAADRIVLETRSRDTFENAEDSFTLVHPAPGQVWLLITSAFHMPRAQSAASAMSVGGCCPTRWVPRRSPACAVRRLSRQRAAGCAGSSGEGMVGLARLFMLPDDMDAAFFPRT